MNWSDVGNAVMEYAPLVGQALRSPAGAVIGIGTIIAKAFDVQDDPKSVMDYIKDYPTQAQLQLQTMMANNLELQKISIDIFKAEVLDRDSARRSATRDPMSIQGLLSIIFTILYFVTFMFHHQLGIADSAMNGMSALQALILSYWFGGMYKKS